LYNKAIARGDKQTHERTQTDQIKRPVDKFPCPIRCGKKVSPNGDMETDQSGEKENLGGKIEI